MPKDKYTEELIRKIKAHPLFERAIANLSAKDPKIFSWISSALVRAEIKKFILEPLFAIKESELAQEKRDEISKEIMHFLAQARDRRQVKEMKYFDHFGFIYPIVQGERFFGYFVLFGLARKYPDDNFQLFTNFINAIVRDIQKEIELTKLFDTIRPRAVALSTIHTVHRLINSTLDLDELLPRIARLCMQVVKANRCSIKLLDKETNTLIPATTIDLRIDRIRLKKLKVGKGIPGKAVASNKILRGDNYISLPLYDDDIIGVITIYDKIDRKQFTFFDQEIMTTLAEQAVVAIKNAQLYRRQEEIIMGSIRALSALLENKIDEPIGSRELVVIIAEELCRRLNLGYEESKTIKYAGMLYGTDKALVPEKILRKSKRLSHKEVGIIKNQPQESVNIVKHLRHLGPVSTIILHKHENFDGTGYPSQLKGKEIPLGSRILHVVEAFVAMHVNRPYREKKSYEIACAEIQTRGGTQFDPDIVAVFLEVVKLPVILTALKKEGYIGEAEMKKFKIKR